MVGRAWQGREVHAILQGHVPRELLPSAWPYLLPSCPLNNGIVLWIHSSHQSLPDQMCLETSGTHTWLSFISLFTLQFSQVDKSKQIFNDRMTFQERWKETKKQKNLEQSTERWEKSLVYCNIRGSKQGMLVRSSWDMVKHGDMEAQWSTDW